MRRIEGHSLWLGHTGDARDSSAILAAGVLVLVDLALNESPPALPRELAYCRFPLLDGPGNPPWLLRTAIETVAGLVRCSTPALVYCSAGLSRSPCIAAGALSLAHGLSADEALVLVARSGPADVSPGLWSEVRAMIP
jgi:protein-tyrosine phosphatase